MMNVYLGLEGGGTTSKLVLFDENGKQLAVSVGGSTNYWSIGLESVTKEILHMLDGAKSAASIPQGAALSIRGFGMSLSGGGVGNMENTLTDALRAHVKLEKVVICNDTLGSLFTVNPNGSGIVLIAGTGSNCALTYTKHSADKEETVNLFCGGWGDKLGDEGSAFWIVWHGIVAVLRQWDAYHVAIDKEQVGASTDVDLCDERNNFAGFDKTYVEQAIRSHFHLEQSNTWHDIIPHFYERFDKAQIADMCIRLAQGASENRDPLCLALFAAAGRHLAKHVLAVLSKAENEFFDQVAIREEHSNQSASLRVPILCVGTMLCNSWNLLRPRFVREFNDGLKRLQSASGSCRSETVGSVTGLRLLKLRKNASYGAAYMAAKACGAHFSVNYEDNFEILDDIQVSTS